MKRIGIYSGTFDPIHEGHLTFAREAIRLRKLDKVFFMVEPRPRRKQGVKAYTHREAMVRLALEDEQKMGSIVLEQSQFSVHETLPVLLERFKHQELYFMMGDDVLAHLAEWPNLEDLMAHVQFIIGLRVKTEGKVGAIFQTLEKLRGTRIQHSVVQLQNVPYSSGKIRSSFRKGIQPSGLKPQVLEYIRDNGLYASFASE